MITKKDNFSAIQQKVVILTLGIMEKRARQEERRHEDQELTKKGSERLDKMQKRMGSRETNEKRLNNNYYILQKIKN